jgi:hypothetical protein
MKFYIIIIYYMSFNDMCKYYFNYDTDNDRNEYKINDKFYNLLNGFIRIKIYNKIPLYIYDSNIQYYYQIYD